MVKFFIPTTKMPDRHSSVVGAGVRSISELVDLDPDSTSLCLHSNLIRNMQALQGLSSLTEVNLSANRISALNGLSTLSGLTHLNLANNQIESLQGLSGLLSLQRLQLQHNRISSLAGMSELHSERTPLQTLRLQGNCLGSLRAFTILSLFGGLRQLFLQDKEGCMLFGLSEADYRLFIAAVAPQVSERHVKFLGFASLTVNERVAQYRFRA